MTYLLSITFYDDYTKTRGRRLLVKELNCDADAINWRSNETCKYRTMRDVYDVSSTVFKVTEKEVVK